ncbi:MAG: XkdX family protein [Spirochaetales bacterium]|nr:XkdX family protein [Spirochaetales bacterium]
MAKKSNNHSPKFEMVKDFYDRGKWSEAKVHNAVVKGWITEEEYAEIVGEDYEE